ncbi:AraC family transcriptional regulator [Pandoraea horticolens]|uniref:AraC family transcriptional regulator n=1 Tax=Pandoraea horticolens TaxID=2508298 RepID=A0A5E4YNK5_9BURK|nr:AraC family transcriptional regulator [Pandoraea horticolens]VVE50399.1 AraC family transcriptional regulator [Pandoraea horticolens]
MKALTQSSGRAEPIAHSSDGSLLQLARRYADAHINPEGVAPTLIDGIVILRETAASALQYAINKPLVAVVLQGEKRVTMGNRSFDFGAGQSLLISTDVPTVSQITKASLAAPYYSLVVELDAAIIAELVGEIGALPYVMDQPVRVDPTEAEVAEAALRLLKLLERPAALAVLGRQLVRELHFWLLSGQHGSAIRALGVTDSHTQRIARAISVIREQYAKPVRMETLANAAGMSLSGFHTHFRNITTLTPLQFQKQLRLLEARRCMLVEGTSITRAAHHVGYESVPQFTREYARMFGQPPARDIRQARMQTSASVLISTKS